MKKLYFCMIVIQALTIFLTPIPARAWGHIKDLENEKEYLLTQVLLNKREIKFCVEDERVESKRIKSLISFFIKTVLEYSDTPLCDLKGLPLTIETITISEQSSCDKESTNLRILHPEIEHQKALLRMNEEMGGFYSNQYTLAHFKSVRERIINDPNFQLFPELFNEPEIQETMGMIDGVINALSVTSIMPTVAVFDFEPAFEDEIYHVIIHEMGHAFGLCDQRDGSLEDCDPEYSSALENGQLSVMAGDLKKGLHEDDTKGLISIFKRLGAECPSIPGTN